MALEELAEDKGEKIGEPVLVRAMQSRKPLQSGDMANSDHIKEAIERDAPKDATGYRKLSEYNSGNNAGTGIGQFKVQYYKY